MNDTATAPAAVIARIEKVLLERGMTQRALAERSGLSTSQMSRIMTMDRKLTAGDLASIATALDTTASYLLGQAEQERPLAMARRLGRVGHAADLDGPFRRAQDLLTLRDLLDQVFTRPAEDDGITVMVSTSGYYKGDGIRLAGEVRAALGLGDQPIEDLEALSAQFGLDAATQPMPGNLHGLLIAEQRPEHVVETGPGSGKTSTAVALINGHDTYGRRRFTLAHELAHLLFSDTALYRAEYAGAQPRGADRLVELRADCFAGHLLAPDGAVADIAAEVNADLGDLPPGIPDHALTAADEDAIVDAATRWTAALVGRLACRYELSVEAAAYRAEESGHINGSQRALISTWPSTRIVEECGDGAAATSTFNAGIFAPADHVIPPHVLLNQALHAYRSGMLGLKPLATLYDTEDHDSLATQLSDAGWGPQY